MKRMTRIRITPWMIKWTLEKSASASARMVVKMAPTMGPKIVPMPPMMTMLTMPMVHAAPKIE